MICKRIQIRVASQLQSLIPSSSTTYKTQGMHPVSEAKMASSVVLDVHKVQAEGQRFPPPYISVEFQPRNRGREGFKVLALLGLFLFSIAMIVSVYGSSKFSLLPYPEHVEHTADPGLVVTAGSTPTTVPTPPLSSTASPTPTKDPKSFINEKHYTNAVYSEKTPCDDPEFFRIGLVITDVEGSWEGTAEKKKDAEKQAAYNAMKDLHPDDLDEVVCGPALSCEDMPDLSCNSPNSDSIARNSQETFLS